MTISNSSNTNDYLSLYIGGYNITPNKLYNIGNYYYHSIYTS